MQITSWQQRISATFGVEPDIDARERFLKGVEIVGECWLWTRRGQFSIGRKRFNPSDMAYVMLKGTIGPHERVETTCGNPKCCVHLKAVSHKQSRETPKNPTLAAA